MTIGIIAIGKFAINVNYPFKIQIQIPSHFHITACILIHVQSQLYLVFTLHILTSAQQTQ